MKVISPKWVWLNVFLLDTGCVGEISINVWINGVKKITRCFLLQDHTYSSISSNHPIKYEYRSWCMFLYISSYWSTKLNQNYLQSTWAEELRVFASVDIEIQRFNHCWHPEAARTEDFHLAGFFTEAGQYRVIISGLGVTCSCGANSSLVNS